MKEFSCGAVVPGCDAKFSGSSVEEILGQVATHAQKDHGMNDIPTEIVEKVKENIHDVGQG